jgi:hypothetical protein
MLTHSYFKSSLLCYVTHTQNRFPFEALSSFCVDKNNLNKGNCIHPAIYGQTPYPSSYRNSPPVGSRRHGTSLPPESMCTDRQTDRQTNTNRCLQRDTYEGVSKSFQTGSITKYTLTMTSNTKGYGSKTHKTDSQNRDTTASSGRELYHLQFLLQAASPETFGYTLICTYKCTVPISYWAGPTSFLTYFLKVP